MIYEISVTGTATIKTEGPSGLVRETRLTDESATVESLPVGIIAQSACVEIREADDD